MAFVVTSRGTGRYRQLIAENSESGDRAVFYPSHGALLNELRLSHGDKKLDVLDGYADEASLEALSYSKGIKLSPFPNRVRDGRFEFQGRTYQLEINKPNEHNAIHGFLQKADFQVEKTETDDEGATVELLHRYGGDRPGFPFPYSLRMAFRLEKGGLSVTTTVVNEGSGDMPFGDGWHPYFTFGVPADELWLELPSGEYLLTDDRMIPTGEARRLQGFDGAAPIGGQSFDTGFVLPPGGPLAKTRLSCPAQDLTLELWQETGPGRYNFLQVYVPPARNAVALEPMTCAADAFNNGLGLIVLAPGEKFEASYGVRIF
jgi:aldose 1-epimerase